VVDLDVVLVHGLYHQPAHMQPLAAALETRGVGVKVPRLHRGSLANDTRAVQEAVDACERRPLVVGHSYGGAVVTGLERVAAFVYMAAFVPDVGESCAALGGPDAPVNAWVRPLPDGFTHIPADVAGDLFYGDCPPSAAQKATSLLVPQASGHGRGEVTAAGWRHAPSLYLVCTQDRAMSPPLQQRMAQRCTDARTFDASHSLYISRPDAVADVLLEFAASG
jgi:pimeloyl-ACP methyl ester carboxylesterase